MSLNSHVIFRPGKDWDRLKPALQAILRTADLWEYVDPGDDDPPEFPTKPIPPRDIPASASAANSSAHNEM